MRDETLLPDDSTVAPFTEWMEGAEPKIRHASTASIQPTLDHSAAKFWGQLHGFEARTFGKALRQCADQFTDLPDPKMKAPMRMANALVSTTQDGLVATHATRSIPPAVRCHVTWRDGGCTIDSCTSRYRCQPHHIVERANGGTHHPDKLTTLCRHHHHVAIHGAGYTIDPHSPPQRRRLLPPTGTDPPVVSAASGSIRHPRSPPTTRAKPPHQWRTLRRAAIMTREKRGHSRLQR